MFMDALNDNHQRFQKREMFQKDYKSSRKCMVQSAFLLENNVREI